MSPTDEPAIGVHDAYSLSTPQDNRRLYARWAETYDEDFVRANGYVYHQNVARILCSDGMGPGPVLDVGCGTGVVGIALKELGVDLIDGIDISPEMLTVANASKVDNKPVYRNLIEADLTQELALDTNIYSGLISVGTFTHGHLGPGSIDELIRVCSPGARAAIGIKSQHFESLGFEAYFAGLRLAKAIGEFAATRTAIYRSHPEADGAIVVTFEVLKP